MHSGLQAGLGESLREQTRALHAEVERSAFMQTLLRGRIDRSSYCRLLRNLQSLYATLEDALTRHAAHPTLAAVSIAGLARNRPLIEDLEYLHGADWETAYAILPATASYVRRLQEIAANAPGLLLAHAYVRYLGDLSGGQMLRRVVAKSLELDSSAGTHFYAFGGPDRTTELARCFRVGMERVDVDLDGIAGLVAEAQWGFAQHQNLFQELWPPVAAL